MKEDTITIAKECPNTHERITYTFTQREIRQILAQQHAIEVFCTSCAQLHTLDVAERQRLTQILKDSE
jgi:redox-regulated HSP33 family molecular chaperone